MKAAKESLRAKDWDAIRESLDCLSLTAVTDSKLPERLDDLWVKGCCRGHVGIATSGASYKLTLPAMPEVGRVGPQGALIIGNIATSAWKVHPPFRFGDFPGKPSDRRRGATDCLVLGFYVGDGTCHLSLSKRP
jgi:hypothetical protein